jgi:partner of Y14 and mago
MASSSNEPETSKAGIYTDEKTGERYIPQTVRADGSVRKEIKIRPGYKPPEDVEIYKNRTAEAWKNRGKGGVPGADAVEEKKEQSASSSKNAKRREARKKAAAAAAADGKTGDASTDAASEGASKDNQKSAADVEPVEPADPELEKAKEARKLAKKLRQARDLKDKKDKGDKLLPEQFEKVIRINELIRQLDALGFDGNGEKKQADG